MDGAVDVSWLSGEMVAGWRGNGRRGADGGPTVPAVRPVRTEWCHEKMGVVLPMPHLALREAMLGEARLVRPEGGIGPAGEQWLVGVHQWLAAMVRRFLLLWAPRAAAMAAMVAKNDPSHSTPAVRG